LGSAAGDVYSGKTAMVGSIGVIATHKEYSEAYRKEGVGVTVIRAGKDKALANSNEKLSEKGRQQIQQMVDASYQVFVEHVAEMRSMSYEQTDKQAAQGQEFIGKAAVDVGLVDKISTFDAVVSDLQKKVLASSENMRENSIRKPYGYSAETQHDLMDSTSTNISGETSMAKKPLSEQEVAALAAGATMSASSAPIENEGAAPEVIAPVAAESEPVDAAAATEPVAEAADNTAATTQLLMAQLKDKDAALLEAGIKIAKLEEKLVDAEATHGPLVEIACKALGNMRIALGGSAISMEGVSATAILAEHKRVSEQFASKFKVGGVAAVSGDTDKNERAASDALTQARLAAVRFSK
jgi:hypothetical protein